MDDSVGSMNRRCMGGGSRFRRALIEIKLGGETLVNEGAKTLKAVFAKIDTGRMGDLAFLAVITGTGRFAYRREDGVLVIPIGALRNRSQILHGDA